MKNVFKTLFCVALVTQCLTNVAVVYSIKTTATKQQNYISEKEMKASPSKSAKRKDVYYNILDNLDQLYTYSIICPDSNIMIDSYENGIFNSDVDPYNLILEIGIDNDKTVRYSLVDCNIKHTSEVGYIVMDITCGDDWYFTFSKVGEDNTNYFAIPNNPNSDVITITQDELHTLNYIRVYEEKGI